ncbi:serine hydrolase [Psychrobacter sp.]|uniref:serine hydrolase domain-containing protein n=1 Tax=Psychrobacter sp. TaxID=56811 RepID=UPI00264877BB|nr:serine hydrolase domain-containing protein [Psychrobacter sp.]MDN6275947.1 beta-lactamase family protein [Psychrobacter sp.]MDN6308373.1 beta-lactamase family protein [Psychrobacter sp.]
MRNQNTNKPIDTAFQQRLQHILTDLQLEDAPAGGAVVVYQAGECIAQASVGSSQLDTSWQPETLAINFSTGKGILATLMHVLVSQGFLTYDVPIAEYWPAFAANGKAHITLRQVMSHQASLFSIQSIDVDSEALLDWSKMISEVAQMPIVAPVDADLYDSAYSALVYGWVLGGLIETVTDMSLANALRKYLTEPLGIADSCYFGVPDNKVNQVAKLVKDFAISNEEESKPSQKQHKPKLKPDSERTLQVYANLPSTACWQQVLTNKQSAEHSSSKRSNEHSKDVSPRLTTAIINSLYFKTSQLNLKNYKSALVPANKQPIDYHRRETLQATIPAANGVASAQALATIYAMLANGGEWKGQVLIDSATFEQLSAPQVTGADAVMPAHMYWRLGYHRLFSICQNQANHSLNADEQGFGHMGYNGSVAWCDPTRQLSFAFVHNFDVTMLNDARQFALTEAVLSLVNTEF